MELLNISRQYAEQKNAEHQSALKQPSTVIDHWLARAKECKTLNDLESMLIEFSRGTWSQSDRSQLSSEYTPIAIKLLGQAEEKQRVLEDLSLLCWNPSRCR